MSALTRCNRCTLDDMRRRAAKRGVLVIVETVAKPDDLAGWISARYEDEDKPSAYFMELPDECACDT